MTTSLDPISIIERYYDPGSRLYDILLSHSSDVASFAREIVYAHPELGVDGDFVYTAAMLHDIGIYQTSAPKIHCVGDKPYIMHGYLGAELLRGLGLELWARVAERHTGMGLYPEDLERLQLSIPVGIYYPVSVEEQIVCYADKFYSKTHLGERKSLEKVRQGLARYGAEALVRFEALHKRFS